MRAPHQISPWRSTPKRCKTRAGRRAEAEDALDRAGRRVDEGLVDLGDGEVVVDRRRARRAAARRARSAACPCRPAAARPPCRRRRARARRRDPRSRGRPSSRPTPPPAARVEVPSACDGEQLARGPRARRSGTGGAAQDVHVGGAVGVHLGARARVGQLDVSVRYVEDAGGPSFVSTNARPSVISTEPRCSTTLGGPGDEQDRARVAPKPRRARPRPSWHGLALDDALARVGGARGFSRGRDGHVALDGAHLGERLARETTSTSAPRWQPEAPGPAVATRTRASSGQRA